MSNDRKKALDAAISQIERTFGKGALMRMGDKVNPLETGVVSYRFPGARHCFRHRWFS